MHLFLTSVLPFLAHNHASAAAFLTCRHYNFHASIIPEFLSDEDRVKMFCETRQQKQLRTRSNHDDYYTTINMQYSNLYHLFVQTPLMQFSPSLVLREKDCIESILKPLLATKYFTRTLQRCVVFNCVNTGLLLGLSKVQSLTNLDLSESKEVNEHLEIIVNSFPNLETLIIQNAEDLKISGIYSKTALFLTSPPPPATKTLRSLRLDEVNALFATTFAPHFSNLRKLELNGRELSLELVDLNPLSSSLSLLTDLSLGKFILENTEPLKNLIHLSSISFSRCRMTELNFLSQENNLPHLTRLRVHSCDGLSTSSFAALSHAPNLQALNLPYNHSFNNGCLEYLGNTIHLRNLDLRGTEIVGDSRSLKMLMQNLFQLEELYLADCHIGNQGAIAGALYSTHSRLRVLNLSECGLVDDDLNEIGALKNTLEVLNLYFNGELTNESLRYCKHLVKLKRLDLAECIGIDDLSPLKDCVNLEELDAGQCEGLTDDSFRVFSQEPDSFPNLRILTVCDCSKLTEKVLDHLSKNNHLVYQLEELNFDWLPIREIFSLSAVARNSLYRLKGLRRIPGFLSCFTLMPIKSIIEDELMRKLKNLDEFFSLDEMYGLWER